MTPLRQRMLDALELRGMALKTRQAYVGAVAGLAKHYRRSPDRLSPHEVQDYLVYLVRERKLASSSVNQANSAFRFFYGSVLGLDGATFELPMRRTPQRLPELLSRAELARLFEHAPNERAGLLLRTGYATGLRLAELCALRLRDFNGSVDHMYVHVHLGKGGKDRLVPLAPELLSTMRAYASGLPKTLRRADGWLFADPRSAWDEHGPQPPSMKTVQRWYHVARQAAGIERKGGIHTLRHCYATHLLEAGVDLYSISTWLGHSHISTTMRYLRLARPEAPAGARVRPISLLSQLPSLH